MCLLSKSHEASFIEVIPFDDGEGGFGGGGGGGGWGREDILFCNKWEWETALLCNDVSH